MKLISFSDRPAVAIFLEAKHITFAENWLTRTRPSSTVAAMKLNAHIRWLTGLYAETVVWPAS